MNRAYINGILLDGSQTMTPQRGLTVLTCGETIQAIVPDETADLDGYETIDFWCP